MKKLSLAVAGLIAFSAHAMAQDTMTRVMPDALTWKSNPAFPEGVQTATLVGDPSKAGDVVVLRIKFPPNFQMPPHTHPYSEVVTIISGAVGSGHGEKFEKNGELMKPGSLWVYPAKHAHYAWTGNEEGVLQVQFIGPGGIDYIVGHRIHLSEGQGLCAERCIRSTCLLMAQSIHHHRAEPRPLLGVKRASIGDAHNVCCWRE